LEAWIEFGRGPLFRLSFAVMILGLLRVLILTLAGMIEAYRQNPDKLVPWKERARNTIAWLFPIRRLWTKRPVYGSASFLFHIGLILVPLFLAAHVLLWKQSVGFAWPSIPQKLADWLTLVVIVTGLGLFLGRLLHPGGRKISRHQDYMWLLLLVIPFATGYICSNAMVGPKTYQGVMLLHIYSADLILVMIPFTKIAHCVLAPLSQFVTGIAWKFPVGAGDRVAATLGYAERPCWVENPRLARKEVETR
jgi:nitrate reductase gamma subunit